MSTNIILVGAGYLIGIGISGLLLGMKTSDGWSNSWEAKNPLGRLYELLSVVLWPIFLVAHILYFPYGLVKWVIMGDYTPKFMYKLNEYIYGKEFNK